MNLAENIGADPPLPVADAITLVGDRKKEWQLPDTELIKARPAPVAGGQGQRAWAEHAVGQGLSQAHGLRRC